ncbi:MAG: phosphate transport system substrate-binding protein [Actinomycetota bacterium]|jgi:phosphate transport system substrate-binding protein|nr:phosphate transport system substrate-binding protein [Actinomycetota bacterium]
MRTKILAAAFAVSALLSVPGTASATDLIGSGSVAAQPVLEKLFDKWESTHSSINFIYTANGGNAGVQDVQQGRSMFAGQARPPLPSDTGTTYIKMYLDGLCIDVNDANSASAIKIPALRDIYLANTTNWSDVKGSNLDETINPYSRDTNGGTYNFFQQAVMNNQPVAGNVTPLTADGLVVNAVKEDDNGIGYAGLAWQGAGLHPLKVNGVPCAPSYIKSLRYPLSRFIWLVVPTDHPNKNVLKFADWARRSHTAGSIITKAGGVPAFNDGF